jgi:hypothetical protein
VHQVDSLTEGRIQDLLILLHLHFDVHGFEADSMGVRHGVLQFCVVAVCGVVMPGINPGTTTDCGS